MGGWMGGRMGGWVGGWEGEKWVDGWGEALHCSISLVVIVVVLCGSTDYLVIHLNIFVYVLM